jgi:hypothetical protein
LTPEFLKEFQNSEYEVHLVGSNEACCQNFSFQQSLISDNTKLKLKQLSWQQKSKMAAKNQNDVKWSFVQLKNQLEPHLSGDFSTLLDAKCCVITFPGIFSWESKMAIKPKGR